MSNAGLVLTGTRPPSVTDFRPHTASGKRGHYGYHTLANKSNIDETLFRSHNPCQMTEEVKFKPPWMYKKLTPEEQIKRKTRQRPLLWAPNPTVSLEGDCVSNFSSLKQKNLSNSDTRYKLLKHTPTFIDETLFGSGFQDCDFDVPWGGKKKLKNHQPYVWVPETMKNRDTTGNTKKIKQRITQRPNTALGVHGETRYSNARPVWKP